LLRLGLLPLLAFVVALLAARRRPARRSSVNRPSACGAVTKPTRLEGPGEMSYFPGSAPGLTQQKPKQAFSALRTGAKLARRKPGIAENARDVWGRGWLLIRRRARSDGHGPTVALWRDFVAIPRW